MLNHTYVGEYGPVKVMHNGVQIAGAVEQTASGEGRVEWDSVYKAKLPGVTVYGKGEQGSLTGVNLIDIGQAMLDNILIGGGVGWEVSIYPQVGYALIRMPVVPGATYTISLDNTDIWLDRLCEMAEDNICVKNRAWYNIGDPGGIVNITNLDTTTYWWMRFRKRNDNSITTEDMDALKLMVVSGKYDADTIPAYEPYCGGMPAPNPDYPIQPVFLSGAVLSDSCVNTAAIPELYALPDGSVRDEFDPQTGVLTRRIGKLVLDGSEAWDIYTHTLYHGFKTDVLSQNFNLAAHCSNMTEPQKQGATSLKKPALWVGVFNKLVYYYAYIKTQKVDLPYWDDNAEDKGLSAWIEHLKEQPLEIWYELSEPEYEQYEPQPLWQPHGAGQLLQSGGDVGDTEIRAEYWDEM